MSIPRAAVMLDNIPRKQHNHAPTRGGVAQPVEQGNHNPFVSKRAPPNTLSNQGVMDYKEPLLLCGVTQG